MCIFRSILGSFSRIAYNIKPIQVYEMHLFAVKLSVHPVHCSKKKRKKNQHNIHIHTQTLTSIGKHAYVWIILLKKKRYNHYIFYLFYSSCIHLHTRDIEIKIMIMIMEYSYSKHIVTFFYINKKFSSFKNEFYLLFFLANFFKEKIHLNTVKFDGFSFRTKMPIKNLYWDL